MILDLIAYGIDQYFFRAGFVAPNAGTPLSRQKLVQCKVIKLKYFIPGIKPMGTNR